MNFSPKLFSIRSSKYKLKRRKKGCLRTPRTSTERKEKGLLYILYNPKHSVFATSVPRCGCSRNVRREKYYRIGFTLDNNFRF